MKLNFLFISYSMIYSKYNYCYDVPKDMPTKYFDGKEWKTLKTRHHVRTKAPKPLDIIPKELDWADLIKEMKEIELVQTASEVTSKNSAIKMAATPKFTIRDCPTLPTTIKTTGNHNTDNCEFKLTTRTTKHPDMKMQKIENLKDGKIMWKFLRPTMKPATVTVKKYFPKTTKQWPIIRPTKQLVTTKMPAKLCGTQGDGGNVPENWANLLKEFLKFVELQKCEPPCKPETTTTDNLYVLAENRRFPFHDEDLMNILMDGVEIDDRLSEDDYLTNQREPSKETLEDQSQILDVEPYEGSIVDNEQEFSGEIVKSSEIKSYFEALQDKHVKRENELSEDKGMETSFDEENYSQSQKEQDKDIRKHINDQDFYGQNDADNLLDFSKDTLNSEDVNEITDDAPKRAHSTEIKNQINNEDDYQDRDSTLEYIDALENDGVGADKYSNERSSVQGGKLEYDGEAVNGTNDQKDDITMKSDKNINSVEF